MSSLNSVVCCLHALIPQSSYKCLIDRLDLICLDSNTKVETEVQSSFEGDDSTVERHPHHSQEFFEHEQVFVPTSCLMEKASARANASTATRNSEPFIMRLLSDIELRLYEQPLEGNWRLVNVGSADASKARSSTVRPFLQVKCLNGEQSSVELPEIIKSLQFTFSFELARKGIRYTFASSPSYSTSLLPFSISIEIFRLFRFSEKNNINSIEEYNPDYWIVEAKSLPISIEQVGIVENELKKLSSLLSGVNVNLKKLDAKIFQQQVPIQQPSNSASMNSTPSTQV